MLRREGRSTAFRDLDRRVRSEVRRDCRADIEVKLRDLGSSSLYRIIRPVSPESVAVLPVFPTLHLMR